MATTAHGVDDQIGGYLGAVSQVNSGDVGDAVDDTWPSAQAGHSRAVAHFDSLFFCRGSRQGRFDGRATARDESKPVVARPGPQCR